MQTVVFDLGGVLVDWNPRYLYRKIFPDEKTVEDFLARVCTPSWNARLDAGEPFAKTIPELTEQFPQYAAQIACYQTRWEEMLGGAVEGTVAILRELKTRNTPLYALTNWPAETFPIARRKFDFLQAFDGIVVSGEEHLIKPNPALFEVLLSRYQLPAQNCLFIDDTAANIAAAAALGFDTVLFTSPKELRRTLTMRGIL